MSTNNRYIPKYLYKRKLLLLREKILKRKYGYLFFRKAISTILPSQADYHYKRNLKKKIMTAWISVWYEEKIEWKLIIKANIHYQLNILEKSLQKWKCFRAHKRFSMLKKQIAIIHSKNNSRRQTLTWVLNKWKIYTKQTYEKKIKNCIAKQFFQSKYRPEFLRNFFKRWMILRKISVRNKLRLQRALKYYEHHLIFVCFEKINLYRSIKKGKYEYRRKYIIIYENKLLKKVIQNWKNVVAFNYRKKQNYLLALTHYVFKLKQRALLSMVVFKNTNKEKKSLLRNFQQEQNEKLVRQYFHVLKLFKEKRKLKRKKVEIAEKLYTKSLNLRVLYTLKTYANHRKDKRILMADLVAKTKLHLKSTKLRILFKKWRSYCVFRILKKQKIWAAKQNEEKRVLKICMRLWRNFWLHKQFKKSKIIQVRIFYHSKLKTNYFCTWKCHIQEILSFKENMKQAVDLYKRHIIEEGLLLIVKSGFLRQDENYEKCKQIFSRHLFLTYKYFNMWRRKTSKLFIKKYSDELDFPLSTGTLEWYPICLIAPRIVKHMK